VGADVVELHTGAYANASGRKRARELARHRKAAALAASLGLQVNAGHGLRCGNVGAYLRAVPQAHTLNIGHSIVSRAVFIGLDRAVREMLQAIRRCGRK